MMRKKQQIVATAIMTLGLILGSVGMASAHYYHPGVVCGLSTDHVVIQSKSAGSTIHRKVQGSITTNYNKGNVSPSNPYRLTGTFDRSVTGWGANAPVMESHSASCAQKPI